MEQKTSNIKKDRFCTVLLAALIVISSFYLSIYTKGCIDCESDVSTGCSGIKASELEYGAVGFSPRADGIGIDYADVLRSATNVIELSDSSGISKLSMGDTTARDEVTWIWIGKLIQVDGYKPEDILAVVSRIAPARTVICEARSGSAGVIVYDSGPRKRIATHQPAGR